MADRTAPRRYSNDNDIAVHHPLPPVVAATTWRRWKAGGMKAIAIRLEDEVSELLGLVAQLEGTTQIDQIREAIASHLERKVAGGDLTARAQAALDEVEREADAKRKAIEQLVGDVSDKVRSTKATGRRQRSSAKAEEAGEQ
jgi:predicted DNA-binding protein